MRTFLFSALIATALTAVACSSPSNGEGDTASDLVEPTSEVSLERSETPRATSQGQPWTGESVISEIARQLFDRASQPVHVFGLTVEKGEEFVPSGRDVLPKPPDTTGWRAEFEGGGVWIVDTGEVIYRFEQATQQFDVIFDYAGGR